MTRTRKRPKKRPRRSRLSSAGVVSFGREAAMAGVAVVLLVAGVWASWDAAQHVMLSKGREHGTLTVTRCTGGSCTGEYTPDGPERARTGMTIEESVAVKAGERFPVVVKPGSKELVRAGTAGLLYAWVPLGGGLLLAALVIGGGLGMARLGWGVAAAGGALLLGAFFAL
ncbi:hypothetical protein [Streptomyces sp. NBC_01429]|uniref:hypothetical protein n=1 Tax=Streptomyces sp. NBC_01429 TaxID=2903862 RepID=UPI003FCE575C